MIRGYALTAHSFAYIPPYFARSLRAGGTCALSNFALSAGNSATRCTVGTCGIAFSEDGCELTVYSVVNYQSPRYAALISPYIYSEPSATSGIFRFFASPTADFTASEILSKGFADTEQASNSFA